VISHDDERFVENTQRIIDRLKETL